jgi:diketogulonate reductase-like aldo/keto reductase
MEQRVFGKTGVSVPVVGQGTWNMEHERKPAIAALRRGIELGMTHLDTAEMYGSGRVEELVGEAIVGLRERVFLASKALPSNASRSGAVKACERSLKRLKTDYLDLYLLHWPSSHPLEDTIAAFEELCERGLVCAWGVSNFDERELARAVSIAGPGRVACNQVLYHLGERTIEHRVLPLCAAHGVALVAYSPFGSGDFASSPELDAVARARGVSVRQVALAFLTRHPVAFVIPKASRVAHVEDNAGAGDLELAPREVAQIDGAFPRGRARRGVPML